MDVDLTADASAFGTNALAELAERIGVPMVPEPARFAARNRVLPVRTPESVEVDLNLATSPFEHDAIARAETVDVEGTPIRVVAPRTWSSSGSSRSGPGTRTTASSTTWRSPSGTRTRNARPGSPEAMMAAVERPTFVVARNPDPGSALPYAAAARDLPGED